MSEITNKELANLLFGMSECNVLPNTTLRQLKLAAERLAAMPDVSGQEPAAHMFPDDIERFQKQETFANAYSVEMISPDKGKTVPLYTKQPAPDEETIKRYCLEFADFYCKSLGEFMQQQSCEPPFDAHAVFDSFLQQQARRAGSEDPNK